MSYVTVDEFKQAVGVDDTMDDANIQAALDAASTAIENYCGRVFLPQDLVATARIFDTDYTGAFGYGQGAPFSWFFGAAWQFRGMDRLRIPDIGVVLSVDLDLNLNGTFSTTLPQGSWMLYPLAVGTPGFNGNYTEIRLRPTSSYAFWPGYQVRVTGMWGWPPNDSPPGPVKTANILQGNRYFRRPSAPFGLWEGPQMGQLAILPTLDPDVAQLLDPYRAQDAAPLWVAV